jgi:hypothetical protein
LISGVEERRCKSTFNYKLNWLLCCIFGKRLAQSMARFLELGLDTFGGIASDKGIRALSGAQVIQNVIDRAVLADELAAQRSWPKYSSLRELLSPFLTARDPGGI